MEHVTLDIEERYAQLRILWTYINIRRYTFIFSVQMEINAGSFVEGKSAVHPNISDSSLSSLQIR